MILLPLFKNFSKSGNRKESLRHVNKTVIDKIEIYSGYHQILIIIY